MDKIEYLPTVDEQGNVTGKATRKDCHAKRLLHPVVHLHVIDEQGNILLQKRSASKLIQPGKWDTAVGGHVDYGEAIEDALRREASEELGLEWFESRRIDSYVWDCPAERELVNSHIAVAPAGFEPRVEAGEADEVRYWSRAEIDEAIDEDLFTPNFIYEYINFLKPALKDE
ncbi:MAG: NUDIX domain-containing protein [Paramuribaculum sp.]|nr:NUDIX domain-containing protein [Paramuribaculum sp.]